MIGGLRFGHNQDETQRENNKNLFTQIKKYLHIVFTHYAYLQLLTCEVCD